MDRPKVKLKRTYAYAANDDAIAVLLFRLIFGTHIGIAPLSQSANILNELENIGRRK